MFEKITFRWQNRTGDSPVDIGLLLESMIFYGKVCIIADRRILKQVIHTFGFEVLNTLIDEGILEVIYTETFIGVTSSAPSGVQIYAPVIFSSPQHTFRIELH